MKILQTISFVGLLFSLPLCAEDIISDVPVVQESIVLDEIPIEVVDESSETLLQESEPIVVEPISIEKSTLQELISEVKIAPDEQKRVLMNQLKTQLKTMSKESRQKTMMELKKSFATTKGEVIKGEHREKNNHESCQHGNHQPKFRHLQLDPKDGSGPHTGGGNGGNGHQGTGQK